MYKRQGEEIAVSTFLRRVSGAFFERDTEICSAQGEVLVQSCSNWLDVYKRQPPRCAAGQNSPTCCAALKWDMTPWPGWTASGRRCPAR